MCILGVPFYAACHLQNCTDNGCIHLFEAGSNFRRVSQHLRNVLPTSSTCATYYLFHECYVVLMLLNTYYLVLGGTFYLFLCYHISPLAMCYLLLITYSLVLGGTYYLFLYSYCISPLARCYLLPLVPCAGCFVTVASIILYTVQYID